MSLLQKGIDKGCLMKPGVWMPEYARGFVPQMMPFGILANSLITMDYRSVRHHFWDFGRICVRELLRGKV
jgi:C-8 sterol isomerase